MTKTITYFDYFVYVFIFLITTHLSAQELVDIGERSTQDSTASTQVRSKTAISIGAGGTLINNDFSNPDFEYFLQFQVKQFFIDHLAVSLNFKKFDIGNYDFDDNGFLSGDVNVEYYLFPKKKMTPFIYVGPGLLIINDFKDTNFKAQGGIGVDMMITHNLGLIASIEANYIVDQETGSQLLEEADDFYYNAHIGVQFFFGNRNYPKSKKFKTIGIDGQPTEIHSNWIGKTVVEPKQSSSNDN